MSDRIPLSSEAVVICTRNRPTELEKTLQSITTHPPSVDLLLCVVDASDGKALERNRTFVESIDSLPSVHWPYEGEPSSARQRNYALDRLPTSVDLIHFIDDDVTVRAHYFDALSETLLNHPEVGGVGGVVAEDPDAPFPHDRSRMKQFFFLGHAALGRVLPSGCTTSAQRPSSSPTSGLRETEWLNGCSTYRRALLHRIRFDDDLAGYAMLEDLDLSYRVGHRSRLVVQPRARLYHRRSSTNRLNAEEYAFARVVHRRWFVEKHADRMSPHLAFWWSMLGRLLILLLSSHPDARTVLSGVLRGLRTVWTRDHPLLRPK